MQGALFNMIQLLSVQMSISVITHVAQMLSNNSDDMSVPLVDLIQVSLEVMVLELI